jgi:hypothetical protein
MRSPAARRSPDRRGTLVGVRATDTDTPPCDCHRFSEGTILPAEPPDWLTALMEPWDAWAGGRISIWGIADSHGPSRDWRRAYRLMPKSHAEWECRVANNPPHIDHEGAVWDEGLEGLSRRLFFLCAAVCEGDQSTHADSHPACEAERLICMELSELLASAVPPSGSDSERQHQAALIAECRGLLHCFSSW